MISTFFSILFALIVIFKNLSLISCIVCDLSTLWATWKIQILDLLQVDKLVHGLGKSNRLVGKLVLTIGMSFS